MRAIIVGAGAIADAHAEALQTFTETQVGAPIELTHVVDTDTERAAAFAQKHSIPSHTERLSEVLAGGTVDVVHVCTPPGSHTAIALAALEAGAHVVLEKPPTLSLQEMDTLMAAERASDGVITVIVQHRFGSGTIRLRRLLEEGALGRVQVAECRTLWFRDDAYYDAPWRGSFDADGGGTTMAHGIHQMDLMLHLLGPWEEVRAIADRQARPSAGEDISMALVKFASGAKATVINSVLSPRQISAVRVDTDSATVEVEHLYGHDESSWTFTPAPSHEKVQELWVPDPDALPSGHVAQLLPTYRALAAGQAPPVTSDDARNTMEFAAAIYRSAFTDQPVRRGEIGPDDPFAASMEGTGAPWAGAQETTGAQERTR